jgi:hypothetical protein
MAEEIVLGEHLAGMPTENKQARGTPTTVEEALDCYWKCKGMPYNVPDYGGFKGWLAEKIAAAREARAVLVPVHMLTDIPPEIPLELELINTAENAGIEIARDGSVLLTDKFGQSDGKRASVECLNRGKLLLSFLRDLPVRVREFYFTLSLTSRRGSDSLQYYSISHESSQAEHRMAFFAAVREGNALVAFKMLGRLREEAHDPGELEFLEATAFFHQNRLSEAIEHARRVAKNNIDTPRATMLILEAHALQGNIDAVAIDLQSASGFGFPQHFAEYLCQVAVANSSDPEASLERAIKIINDMPEAPQEGSGIFQVWNRHSCQLAVQLVEHEQQLALRALAIEQGGSKNTTEEPNATEPLRKRQIECALAMDSDMAQRLLACELDEAYREIVIRLLNCGRPGKEDFLQAFMTFWRIGDRVVFLENVLSNLERLISSWTPNDDIWQLLTWAYQEALSCSRGADAELLREKLGASPAAVERLNDAAALSVADRLERQLSPMGRLALHSAKWDLAQSDNGPSMWKDAGMISLGFFRVVELEFNERLIFPALQSIDLEALETETKRLQSSQASQTEKKVVECWKGMLPLLRKAKQDRKGLELGRLELLLQKVRLVNGPDSFLKASLNAAIARRLSAKGIGAFQSGELANMLDDNAREKFRNPAAHTRYVDLETARECKCYVENVLEKLVEYTKSGAEAEPTLH